MNMRNLRRAVVGKELSIVPTGPVEADTEFQARRLTYAVAVARLYLKGEADAGRIAKALGRTTERALQIIRSGVNYMESAGWLVPASAPWASQEESPKSGRGRG